MMTMAIQCKGHYENGEYILERMPDIPAGRIRFTITFHGVDEGAHDKTELQKHREAFKEFSAAMAAIDDEPITDEDIADLAKMRVNTKRTLDL